MIAYSEHDKLEDSELAKAELLGVTGRAIREDMSRGDDGLDSDQLIDSRQTDWFARFAVERAKLRAVSGDEVPAMTLKIMQELTPALELGRPSVGNRHALDLSAARKACELLQQEGYDAPEHLLQQLLTSDASSTRRR